MKTAAARNPIPYVLGGLGLAALENRYIGEELPEQLKNVNLGIGATTGYILKDPRYRLAALASLPFKQLGLFGIGAMDKLRRQQQSLVDANLDVADVNRDTAELNRSNAGSDRAIKMMFLLPALAAGAGLGYLGYEKWRKAKQQIPRYRTMGERGRVSGARSKIRIDIPASAVPRDFYESLAAPEDEGKAHMRLLELANPGARERAFNEIREAVPYDDLAKMSSFVKQSMSDEPVSVPNFLWTLGKEITGIPSVARGLGDAGMALSSYTNDEPKQFGRYGLAALGNLGLGLVGLRTGLAPALRMAIGNPRLAAHLGIGKTLTGLKPRFPWTAGFINRWAGPGGRDYDASLTNKWHYNPNAFAWTGRNPRKDRFVAGSPALAQMGNATPLIRETYGAGGRSPVMSALYQKFLTKGRPTTLPGHVMELGRYGANRALQGAYGLRQGMGRYPNLSLAVAGAPVAGIGLEVQRRREEEARSQLKNYLPDWAANKGHFGLPISGAMSNTFQMLGMPDTSSKLREQLLVPTPTDPFSRMRL